MGVASGLDAQTKTDQLLLALWLLARRCKARKLALIEVKF
jgi:hypothetical protein